MKHMKKIISLILAMLMIVSLAVYIFCIIYFNLKSLDAGT